MIFSPTFCAEEMLAILLEPQQPYLAHHNVGAPLLGTVMSLEAMAECALLRLGDTPGTISRVLAGEDCLAPTPKALCCRLRPDQAGAHALLTDRGSPVFSCDFSFQREPTPFAGTIPPTPAEGADSQTIYSCFFHGPAFQVVEQAWLEGDTMVARCRADLPPLTHDSTRRAVLPVRALEFCLQTAGLLDAALRHEMSVPRSIDQIHLYGTQDLSGLWARAGSSGTGTDICAYNGRGEVVVSVMGYQTRTMPAEGQAFWQLCSSFF